MMMRSKFMASLLFLSMAAMLASVSDVPAADAPAVKLLYSEDFSNYKTGETPAGFADNCIVAEENGKKFLQFKPGKSNYVYADANGAQGGSGKWTDYELDFRFRFPAAGKIGFYGMVRSGGARPAEKYLWYYVPVMQNTCQTYAHGLKELTPPSPVKWIDCMLQPLQNDRWYRAVFRVVGKYASVFLEDGGRLVPVFEEEMPVGGGGINFLSYNPMDLTDIKVREVPAGSGGSAMKDESSLKEENGLRVATAPSRLKVAVPESAGEISMEMRVGNMQPGLSMTLLFNDGSKADIQAKSSAVTAKRKIKEKNVTREETLTLPDACVEFSLPRIKKFVRPNPDCYPDNMKVDLAKGWEKLPGASEYLIPFTIKLDDKGVQYWIDGRYAGRTDKAARLKEIQLRLPTGAGVSEVRCLKGSDESRFITLDMGRMNHPGAMKDAAVSLDKDRAGSNVVPLLAGSGANADLSLARELTRGGMEVDPYLSRTAFDGMEESFIFSVPLVQYIRAWVLCAAEENPARDPVLTARLTRYARGGRGDAVADSTVWLPAGGEKPGPGIVKAGSVSYMDKGKKKTLPLWRVEMLLPAGRIQDLLFTDKNGMLSDHRYLDFELLGKVEDKSNKPDKTSVSGVHIFGVTLEKSPVEMEVRQEQPGNIFQEGEKAQLQVALRPLEAGGCTLKWSIRDVEGKRITSGERKLSLEAGREAVIAIPLAMKERGWYGIDIALHDAAGRLLTEHPAAFALLGADTRRAGYESPYGTWWFGGAHFGSTDPNIAGPLMHKAGLRKTTMGFSKNTEADMAPWKITGFQIPWRGALYNNVDLKTGAARYEEMVRDYLQKFPHCTSALIFHESYGGGLPPELYDGRPGAMEEAEASAAQRRWDIALATTRMYREKFPHIKLVFGNCNGGPGLLAQFLRHKDTNPKDYLDYLGIEAAGQSFMPEKLTEFGTQTAWIIRETGRKMGYDLPVTAAYEWIYRTQRALGPQRLAEWYVRDALIAHAYRFPSISIALLYDAGNCYFNSLWGASGFCERYPLLYPKPAYVAYATLTRVLDSAVLVRRVPTGSLTNYALEFKRGGEYIYVLWTPRGNSLNTLRFAADTKVVVEDLYGRSREAAVRAREMVLEAGTAASYVTSSVRVESITAGKRSFPENTPPAGAVVAEAMTALDNWQVIEGKDDRLDNPQSGNIPLRTAGKFTLKEASDAEKGQCLELELVPEGKLADVVNEYTVLKLKKPVEVTGRPSTLGVWVKGNSGWGRIMWEFSDAEGESWLSSGAGGWGCDILDWPGDISINFDGWCFLRFPIAEDSPARIINPGGLNAQWVKTKADGKGNRKVDYPIRLTGLAVEMGRKTLDLTEMVPLPTVIRLKDLSVY